MKQPLSFLNIVHAKRNQKYCCTGHENFGEMRMLKLILYCITDGISLVIGVFVYKVKLLKCFNVANYNMPKSTIPL